MTQTFRSKPSDDKIFYSVSEAAEILFGSASKARLVRSSIAKGQIKAQKFNDRYYVRIDELIKRGGDHAQLSKAINGKEETN